MSKLITKIFRRNPRAPEKDVKYLDFSFVQYDLIRSSAYRLVDNNDDDDDTASIRTVSTNATADNLPGTGRIIDLWVYQFLGRKIERFANRFSMARLPPARILQCLGRGKDLIWRIAIVTPVSDVIARIHKHPRHPGGGGVVVAGLKSLVKQTQSGSIYRSAAALTALFHIATTHYLYAEFVSSATHFLPIFHAESLAEDLIDSNSVKQHLNLLTCLVRQWLPSPIAVTKTEQLWPRLIELLDSYRAQFRGGDTHSESSENGLLEILRDGCILYSQCTLAWRQFSFVKRSYYSKSIVDIIYYLTILLIHCIALQYQRLAKAGHAAHLQRMVLFAYLSWIQACCVSYTLENWMKFKIECKCVSVTHILIQYGYFTSDADPFHYQGKKLPRKQKLEGGYQTILSQHVEAWIPRTRRLLLSFDELDREARDTALLARITPSPERHWSEFSNEKLSLSRERARQHLARHTDVSEDDIKSLKKSWAVGRPMNIRGILGLDCVIYGVLKLDFVWSLTTGDEYDDLFRWRSYKIDCQARHEWGEYLRSNLEWDWDVASCLKNLFRQPKPATRKWAQHQAGPQATIVADETGECKLDVTIDGAHLGPPKSVEVKYTNSAGEVEYLRCVLEPVSTKHDPAVVGKGGPRLPEETAAESMPTWASDALVESRIVDEEDGAGDECVSEDLEDKHSIEDQGQSDSSLDCSPVNDFSRGTRKTISGQPVSGASDRAERVRQWYDYIY